MTELAARSRYRRLILNLIFGLAAILQYTDIQTTVETRLYKKMSPEH